jgi:hypothetical protein
MKYAIVTWASGEAFCRSMGFQVYLNSLKNVAAAYYCFTTDMPADVREYLAKRNITVVDIDPDSVHYLVRDRNLFYWEFLINNLGKHHYYVFTDSKDVIFQENPFVHMNGGDRVYLASEGMRHDQSPWNLNDQTESQKGVREFIINPSDRPVINAGVFMGSGNRLKDLFFLLWSNTIRSVGACTEQGVLNYLVNFLENDPDYMIMNPKTSSFCLTGEAVKWGHMKTEVKDGVFYPEDSIFPYAIVHQWERTSHVKEILIKYA